MKTNYRVTIATGGNGFIDPIEKDSVQIKIVGIRYMETLSTKWMNLFAKFEKNTIDVFSFDDLDVGKFSEVQILVLEKIRSQNFSEKNLTSLGPASGN